ncbi:hypothetical protein BDZ45DRAFT_693371 [Acephala macrosclerotiorum]|nr:hypothetical protein BDZ45DRAFT_693371 [Acephala macrosclerotiorum]
MDIQLCLEDGKGYLLSGFPRSLTIGDKPPRCGVSSGLKFWLRCSALVFARCTKIINTASSSDVVQEPEVPDSVDPSELEREAILERERERVRLEEVELLRLKSLAHLFTFFFINALGHQGSDIPPCALGSGTVQRAPTLSIATMTLVPGGTTSATIVTSQPSLSSAISPSSIGTTSTNGAVQTTLPSPSTTNAAMSGTIETVTVSGSVIVTSATSSTDVSTNSNANHGL